MPDDGTLKFNDVFKKEIELINERRASDKPARKIMLEEDGTDSTGEIVLRPKEDAKLVGLALSGGGVRSSTFCLGALQALDEAKVLDRVDYLSTVSGGGYIGCSLSSALQTTQGKFPFKPDAVEDETPSMQHIRNHSNYLFPNGAIDLLRNASIYVRGLVANFLLVTPILLIGAALTIVSYLSPVLSPVSSGWTTFFAIPVPNIFSFDNFVVTVYLSLILLAVTIVWGLLRSTKRFQSRSEVPDRFTTGVGWLVLIIFFSAFCELQPFVLDALIVDQQPGTFFGSLAAGIDRIAVAFAPVAAVIAFLGNKLGEYIKSAKESSSLKTQFAGYAAKAAVYLAALVLPIVLWAIYLNITYWGICISHAGSGCDYPTWLYKFAHHLFGERQPAAKLYLLLAAIFLLLMLFLRPNANSLHPLYRDRLGTAFLFKPQDTLPNNKTLDSLRIKLSDVTGKWGPYHLINAALNIQNSKVANKRGRNADFFLFSQNFVGSETTGYVPTKDMEQVASTLDLATVMAVSGAAASSNMGAETIKPLTPTLAILNVRLGYWLRNPMRVQDVMEAKEHGFLGWLRNPMQMAKGSRRNIFANFYFIAELFGLLNEKRKSIYLTDGGHIENLGLYELLKRCCQVIIVIDAEADPEMAFGSFNTLVRYARIDLGVEIDLPWQEITDTTQEISKEMDKEGNSKKKKGPHCAIGEITYPATGDPKRGKERKGVLVYIKSSLTGDENDYVFHYRKRHSAFPHETTLDQLFSEEQFEAYRALGYHAAYGLFDRRDDFAKLDNKEYPLARRHAALLDELFPRMTSGKPPQTGGTRAHTEGGTSGQSGSGPPDQKQHFVDWF